MNYPPLPSGNAARPSPLDICIVTPEIFEQSEQQDIAVAFAALADTLADAGHRITVLYTGKGNHALAPLIESYRNKNITLVSLPARKGPKIISPDFIARPYEAYLWLKERRFDIIHYSDFAGVGHYIALAKHQGLAFAETLLCAHAFGASLWHKHIEHIFPRKVGDLCLDFMERQSIAYADILVSPSRYMLEKMAEQGWKFPAQTHVQQNILSGVSHAASAASQAHPVHEIVFYGDLLPHNGFELFCDELDCLTPAELQNTRIAFLGNSFDHPSGNTGDYIKWRARKWKFTWAIVSGKSRDEAVDYLREHAVLAVMPSRDGNAPYAVLECLGAGIPLIASDVGGIPEMIVTEDHDRTLFPYRADRLAEKIRAALRHGAHTARPAVSFAANKKAWVDWHASVSLPPRVAPLVPFTKDNAPLVSICMCHFNRPHYLKEALHSVMEQDYPNIEVVLVDDASTKPEAQKYLDTIEPEFRARGWQLIRQKDNLFQGATTNSAVRRARGVYVKLFDDDDIAKPHEISTFVRVAQKTGADIVSCAAETFTGHKIPEVGAQFGLSLPVGASLAVGFYQNSFGVNNSLIKRDVFLALGGYCEEYGFGHTDWDFHARAAFKGYRAEVVPEALFLYRKMPDAMSRTTSYYANSMLNFRTFSGHFPPEFRPMLLLAYGMAKGVVLFPSAVFDWKHPSASWWLVRQRLKKAWLALRGRL